MVTYAFADGAPVPFPVSGGFDLAAINVMLDEPEAGIKA